MFKKCLKGYYNKRFLVLSHVLYSQFLKTRHGLRIIIKSVAKSCPYLDLFLPVPMNVLKSDGDDFHTNHKKSIWKITHL